MKRPLSHVAGAESGRGDPKHVEALLKAFRVSEADHGESVAGVHGLHAYPGRMHPLWARRLIKTLPENASILDPFCGGGTVLVEARRQRRYARGSDINPIAIRLARLKCVPHAPATRVLEEAERCAEGCLTRRKTPFSALAEGETSWPKHVLAGLISLRDEIQKTRDPAVREVLLFCLSPLLDKFSARPGRPAPRVPRTAVRDNFLSRAQRWTAAWEELDLLPFAEAEQADARWLPWKPLTSTAVISSPPYPGVFDYAERQARRIAWLGAKAAVAEVQKKEIGRRSGPPKWTEDMFFALKQMARTLKTGGTIHLVLGDGVMRDRVIRTDIAIAEMCAQLPLEAVAVGSQERPHFHRPTQAAFAGNPRREHLILLRKTR